MSPSSGYFSPLLLLLISGTMMSQKLTAFGSPDDRDHVTINGHVPLNHFQLYSGGHNISNRQYWADIAFTGIHGYAIAGIWLLFGLGFGSYIIIRNSRASSSSPIVDYPDSSYILFFSLIVIFSVLAIVESSFVVVADKDILHRTKTLIETILDSGSVAQKTMQRTKTILMNMQTVIEPYDSKTGYLLNVTTHSLRRESLSIQEFVDKSRHSGNEAIVALYVGNLVVVIANLVFLVVALVSFIFRWPLGLIIIIFCFWILTTLSWVLTGINFSFHNFAVDICNALEDFGQNPQNSSLRSVLPCANSTNSNNMIVHIGYTVHNVMYQLNSKLTELPTTLEPTKKVDDNLPVWSVCDPFAGAPNYTFTPDKCPKNAIPIGNLPNILSRFTCYDTSKNCQGEGRFLPKPIYEKCRLFSESLQGLINIFPDLVSLIKCSQVKQTFSSIVQHQCKPFREAALQLWSSMLSLSISMMLLTLLWIVKAYQDKGKHFSRCSIVPGDV